MSLYTAQGVLLARRTANNSSSVNFNSSMSSTYETYLLEIRKLFMQTDDAEPELRFGTDSTYESGASSYYAFAYGGSSSGTTVGANNSVTADSIRLTRVGYGNDTNEYGVTDIMLYHPSDATLATFVKGTQISRRTITDVIDLSTIGGGIITPTAHNSVQVVPSTGVLVSGEFSLYGIPR